MKQNQTAPNVNNNPIELCHISRHSLYIQHSKVWEFSVSVFVGYELCNELFSSTHSSTLPHWEPTGLCITAGIPRQTFWVWNCPEAVSVFGYLCHSSQVVVFWVVMLCSLTGGYRCFRRTFCLPSSGVILKNAPLKHQHLSMITQCNSPKTTIWTITTAKTLNLHFLCLTTEKSKSC
jgi:hypothetical protein